jgi:hypothetical protein
MKINNSDRSFTGIIDSLVSRIGDDERNRISGIYLDETLMEFFSLENEMPVPPISVSELDYGTGAGITENLIHVIPEYLRGHTLLEKRKPSSEQHTLQFVKAVQGRLIDFVHILRLDFKLSGNYGRISGKGDNQTFPPYNSDRIRYKSRLVPVVKGSDASLIESVRLKSHLEVDTDGKRFTSVFFDEFSSTEISIDFSMKAGSDIFSIPPKIYQFIPYDYFTACMNIPDPAASKLEKAAELFEPLFFYLYFQYRERHHEIDEKQLSICDEYLECSGTGVSQKPLLQESLRDFFTRYTLYRDDDLMLKGLRRINVNE